METAGQSQTRHEAVPVGQGTPHRAGEQLGRFQIVSRLGSGAFGTVYRALDPVLGREVALKVPRAAALESPEARARFLREPKAAAHLRHPNIIPIYDAGADGDAYYIASAFIEGRTLADALEERRADFRRAAEIVRPLAEALDYAHRNGVVHRDVKPSNVMLDARGEPLLMDFGLARLESSQEKLTQDGAVMGTPAYMAPEQADGSLGEVGPASDQYSLGVVLYELLCGEPPFSGPPAVLLFNVVHQKPASPRSIDARIPRDLETICLRAMAKRPADRYTSCAELAEDLRRWLSDEPIRARRMGLAERWTRWCRRNPALAAVSAVAVVLLLAVATIATAGYVREARLREQTERALAAAQEAERKAATSSKEAERQRQAAFRERDAAEEARRREAASAQEARRQRLVAEQQRDAAEEARRKETEAKEETDRQRQVAERERAAAEEVRKEAETNLYLLRLAFAQQHLAANNGPLAQEHLDACPLDKRGWEWGYLKCRCREELLTIAGHGGTASSAVFSPDGRWIAVGGGDKAVKILQAWDGELLRTWPDLPASVSSLVLSPDGSRLVAATFDGSIHVWDLASEQKCSFQAHRKGVCAVAFGLDGKSFASGGGEGTLKLWDAATGEEIRVFDGLTQPVRSVALSPDGRWIAASGMIWPTDGSGAPDAFQTDAEAFSAVAFRPDGNQIAWGGAGNGRASLDHDEPALSLCDLEARRQTQKLRGHTAPVTAVAYSPDGTRIVSGSGNGTIKVWDTATGEEVITFREHTAAVNCLAFSPGGRRLASASSDGTVKIFSTVGQIYDLGDDSRGVALASARFTPDSRQLVVAAGGKIMIWNISRRRCTLAKTRSMPISPASHRTGGPLSVMDAAGRRVAYLGGDNMAVVVWDIVREREVFHRDPPSKGAWPARLRFSPDGEKVAATYSVADSGKGHYEVYVWDLSNGTAVFTFGVEDPAAGRPATSLDHPVILEFSADGSQFGFWPGRGAPFCLWDAKTGEEIAREPQDRDSCRGFHFSPDGRHVLFASGRLMRLPGKDHPMTVALPDGAVRRGAIFSPDGMRIAAPYPSEVRIFGVDSFSNPLSMIKLPSAGADYAPGQLSYDVAMAFSGDGKRLATVYQGLVNVWDAGTGKRLLRLPGLPIYFTELAFSPDGQWLLFSNHSNMPLTLCDVSDERAHAISNADEMAAAGPPVEVPE